jgi:hypothetical protein
MSKSLRETNVSGEDRQSSSKHRTRQQEAEEEVMNTSFGQQDELSSHEHRLDLEEGTETEDEVDGSSHSDDHGASSSSSSDTSSSSSQARFLPVTLAFKNLFFSVKVRKGKNPFQKKHKKTLLKDLHGELRPGEVTAIMGPSGTVPSFPSFVIVVCMMLMLGANTQERARQRYSTCLPAVCRAAKREVHSPSTEFRKQRSLATGGSD